MKNITNLFVIYICVFSLLFVHTAPIHAGVIGTEILFEEFHNENNRELLLGILEREDAQVLLVQNGVSAELAQARINSMTDSEVQMLVNNFEDLPAAGSIGTAAALVILILVILVLALGR